MSLKLTELDDDHFADERISDQTVLVSYSLPLTFFHELGAENLSVKRVPNKDSVRLYELFVPKEDVMFVTMSNCAVETAMLAFDYLNDLIHSQGIIVLISSIQGSVARWERHLFAEVNDLDVHYLALLIDHLEVVFVYLKNKPGILVAIEIDEVTGLVTMS